MTKLKLDSLNVPVNFSKMEEDVLNYWDENNIFERSVKERPDDKPFVFYDGPPFATGLPHYGHLLGSIMKDIIPRYWTMKGYKVERRWGWDCHGLPIENIIEQELDLKGGKKGIEEYGIAKFNDACKAAILRFDAEWKKVIRRVGRWVDMEHSYKTMDVSYMESVWWAFKQLHEKELVYQGKKVILYCPRCATPLSNFEIAMDNSYKDITEDSTTYKFPVVGQEKTYLLAWSTTPWNKIATPALAVNPSLTYVKVKQNDEMYILAETRLVMLQGEYEIVEKYTGKDLEQISFTQLYDFYPERNGKRAGVVVADEFVTAEEGTGIVTLAIYGEDDYRVMVKHNIQLIEHVDEEGKFKPEVTPWAGMYILKANSLIDEALRERNLIYDIQPCTHSVPTCYRCNTRLYYAPLPAWFVNIQKLKSQLVESNESISWYPDHLKLGRFGKGLETAPDWNISRSRYWGTPMPIWIDDASKQYRVIGSIADLKQWAVNQSQVENITDIHRQYLDDIELYVDDAKTIKGKRIKEVFDCWVESGSMPYAAEHYPFENKQKFESRFPAQFICEYIAQTRAWFYTLHVMSSALFGKPSFENALTTGTIMAEDGSKMSKSKRNFPDPMQVINDYGVDSLRLYFSSSPIMKTAENINFSKATINEIRKKVVNIAWNVFTFYKLYESTGEDMSFPKNPKHILDKWIISHTEAITQSVMESMDHYDVVMASRSLMDYIDKLSTWYLRLSRERLKDNTNQEARQTLKAALYRWSLLIAPFAPFIAEMLYQNMGGSDSIHLELLPSADVSAIDPQLMTNMTVVQEIVAQGHAGRKNSALSLKQPLAEVTVAGRQSLDGVYEDIIKQELNVKAIKWVADTSAALVVTLDTKLTPALIDEGKARLIIRDIQAARKSMGAQLNDIVDVELPEWPTLYENMIKEKVKAASLIKGSILKVTRANA